MRQLTGDQRLALEQAAVAFAEQAGIFALEAVVPAADWDNLNDFLPPGEAELTGEKIALVELTGRAVAANAVATERLAYRSDGMSDAQYAVALQEIINAYEQVVENRGSKVGEIASPRARKD